MYIHQIQFYRWSANGSVEGTVNVKGDNAALSIKLLPEELAQLEAVANAAYERSHRKMVEEISKPLETNLLTAPTQPIQDADFTEAADDGMGF